MANRSTGGPGSPGPVVAADAAAAAGSSCAPLGGAGRPTRPWWPFCVLLPSSWRGVTGRLSLSLEAKALSEDAGGPADDEDVDTAVVLPVSVESPIRVSKLSVEGETSTSEMLLDSDMAGLFVAPTVGTVCLL